MATISFAGAKCHGDDRDSYYPVKGTAQVTARDAKAVCNGDDGRPVCPIKEQCLEYALEMRERFGIWGGLSERQRAKVARDRRIAAKKVELEAERKKNKRAAAARKGWENRRSSSVPSAKPLTLKQCLAQGLITRGEYDQEMEHRAARAARTRRTTSATQATRRRAA